MRYETPGMILQESSGALIISIDESYNVIINSVSYKSGTYSNSPFLRYLNRRKKDKLL